MYCACKISSNRTLTEPKTILFPQSGEYCWNLQCNRDSQKSSFDFIRAALLRRIFQLCLPWMCECANIWEHDRNGHRFFFLNWNVLHTDTSIPNQRNKNKNKILADDHRHSYCDSNFFFFIVSIHASVCDISFLFCQLTDFDLYWRWQTLSWMYV